MSLTVCVIRDRAIDSFGNPFFAPSVGAAVRSFSDAVNNDAADNMMFKHPEDYDLYVCGTYEQESGLFKTDVPRMISVGKDVKVKV